MSSYATCAARPHGSRRGGYRRSMWSASMGPAVAAIAAAIHFAQPWAGATCVGDVNADGQVDGGDLGQILRAWGSPYGDLDGDGTTGGSDIGVVMGCWGPCPDPCDGLFHDLVFVGQVATMQENGWQATLDGEVDVGPDGTASGAVTVSYFDGAAATIGFDGLSFTVTVGETVLDLDACGHPLFVLVNGQATPIDSVLEPSAGELGKAAGPSDLSPLALACTTLVVLNGTEQWQCYAEAEQASSDGVAGLCKPSCKNAAMAVTLVFLGGTVVVCAAATIACAWFSVMTLGGVTVGCALLAVLCEGVALYGTDWVYTKVLEWWTEQ